MKIFELAKELEIKTQDVMNFLKNNKFKYTSVNQHLDLIDEGKLRSLLKDFKKEEKENFNEIKIEEDLEIRNLDKVKLLGIYYNYKKGKYIPITLEIVPEQFDSLNVKKYNEYTTIYNAKNTLSELMNNNNLFVPSPLEKLLNKRRKK